MNTFYGPLQRILSKILGIGQTMATVANGISNWFFFWWICFRCAIFEKINSISAATGQWSLINDQWSILTITMSDSWVQSSINKCNRIAVELILLWVSTSHQYVFIIWPDIKFYRTHFLPHFPGMKQTSVRSSTIEMNWWCTKNQFHWKHIFKVKVKNINFFLQFFFCDLLWLLLLLIVILYIL